MSNLTKAAHFELNDSVNLRGKKTCVETIYENTK